MVPAASAADGVNVAVFVPALYAVVPATGVAPAASAKPTVAACTGSENVAVGATDVATPVALFAGVVPVTVGGVVSAATVVNDQLNGAAIVLPAVSFTPDTVAVYVVLGARAPEGVKVTVLLVPLYEALPPSGLAPADRMNPIVAGWTGSENVAVGATDAATPVALFAGVLPVTVGGVVSGGAAAAVVNDHVNGAAIVLPAVSFTPEMVAVYVVEAASDADGVNDAVLVDRVVGDRPRDGRRTRGEGEADGGSLHRLREGGRRGHRRGHTRRVVRGRVARDRRRGRVGRRSGGERHVDPVVRSLEARVRERARGAVPVDAVRAVDARAQGVEGRVVDPDRGEEVVVDRVLAHRGQVRRDVGGVRRDRDGRRERHLLPTAARLVGEVRGGEARPGRVPQVAHVGAGVRRVLVEPDAGYEAGDVGAELHAELD